MRGGGYCTRKNREVGRGGSRRDLSLCTPVRSLMGKFGFWNQTDFAQPAFGVPLGKVIPALGASVLPAVKWG